MPDQPGPHITNDYAVYVEYVAKKLAENPTISSYGLPYAVKNIDGVNHLDENAVLSMLNHLADKNIELRQAGNDSIDLFKKAYYYLGSICDEPDSAEDFELVRESDLIISNAKFAVAERLNNYPDLKESLLSLKHIVTIDYSEELIGTDTVGGVQTWCPNFRYFHTQDSLHFVSDHLKHTRSVPFTGTFLKAQVFIKICRFDCTDQFQADGPAFRDAFLYILFDGSKDHCSDSV